MTTHPPRTSERPSFLVSQRFWIYGLLFLLVLGMLWWDRENRRALAPPSPASTGGEAPSSASTLPAR